MIDGFHRAVGPVQPSERPMDLPPYGCQLGMERQEEATCLFALWDGGAGRTYVQCVTHDYVALAQDTTTEQIQAAIARLSLPATQQEPEVGEKDSK